MDPMLPQITEDTLIGMELHLHVFRPDYCTKAAAVIFGPQCGIFADCYEIYAENLHDNDSADNYYPYGEGNTVSEALAEALMKINRIPNSHFDLAIDRVKKYTVDTVSCLDLPKHGYLLTNLVIPNED